MYYCLSKDAIDATVTDATGATVRTHRIGGGHDRRHQLPQGDEQLLS